MEAKWPFFMITFVLLFGMGYLMSTMERTSVMDHWTTRRCELPVMIAARFFKPDSDSRTPSEFSSDNFSFCTQEYVEKFMGLLMTPINALFGKQLGITNSMSDLMGSIRQMMNQMYNSFTVYLDSYFKKFHSSVFQLSRVVQRLRMAIGRMSAVAMSMIYAGISAFRSMINSIQVVVRVILIICTIMLAIIIILFFVLFPVIPMILSTLTAVVTIVIALGPVMSSSIAGEAESKKSGFCFEKGTRIPVRRMDGRTEIMAVEDVRLGDHLSYGCGYITTILQMTPEHVSMYDLEGIHVSGSHLVQHETDKEQWIAVEQDGRSNAIPSTDKNLYCFNTTSHRIPIVSKSLQVIFFRDWEEMDETDKDAHTQWTQMIHTMLNPTEPPLLESPPCETPLLSPYTQVYTPEGYVLLGNIDIGDWVIDETRQPTRVLGIVSGYVKGQPNEKEWNTAIYKKEEDCWRICESTLSPSQTNITGYHLITESGTFVYYHRKNNTMDIIRDFTEVGHDRIEETYSFIADRLRS